MNIEKYFREMYSQLWQGNDLDQIDYFYVKDFEEVISTCDEDKNPVEIKIKYDDIIKQAIWQKETQDNVTFELGKIIQC